MNKRIFPGIALLMLAPLSGNVYGQWYGGYPSFSSTPMEGMQRGYADVLRSRGVAAELGSEAAINMQDAKSKYIDNAYKWTQTYWDRKNLGDSQIAAERAKDREAREKYLAYKHSQPPTPVGLSRSQLDPSSGDLNWPLALTADEYAPQRMKIEELFQVRAQTGTTAKLVFDVSNVAEEMKGVLKTQIRDMPPNDYIAASKFLDGLVQEARLPT